MKRNLCLNIHIVFNDYKRRFNIIIKDKFGFNISRQIATVGDNLIYIPIKFIGEIEVIPFNDLNISPTKYVRYVNCFENVIYQMNFTFYKLLTISYINLIDNTYGFGINIARLHFKK